MIKRFNSINEEFLGIDFKKIKDLAYEFSKTKDFRSVLASLDTSVLNSILNEFNKIKDKYKSIESFGKLLLNKAEAKNEGAISTVILSAFGIHFTLKLLAALKNNWRFGKFLARLFSSGKDMVFTQIRDGVIGVLFCIWLIGYTVGSHSSISDYYNIKGDTYTNLPFEWNGIHNYYVTDGKGKTYDFIKMDDRYDIEYKGEKIGYYKNNTIYNLLDNEILNDGESTPDVFTEVEIDLEEMLEISKTGDIKKLNKEVNKRELEIKRLNKEIDSLSANTFDIDSKQNKKPSRKISKNKPHFKNKNNESLILENVAMAKKVLRDNNISTDEEINFLNDIYYAFDDIIDNPAYLRTKPFLLDEAERNLSDELKDKIAKHNFKLEELIYELKYVSRHGAKKSHLRSKIMIANAYVETKEFLTRQASIGYLGLFTKFIVNHNLSSDEIVFIYNKIIKNRDIINNLRDSNYQLKQLMSFEVPTELTNSLNYLEKWRKINHFIREIPTAQKNLIWNDGWFIIEDKLMIEHLSRCILKLLEYNRLKEAFLSKIAAIKTTSMFIELISMTTNSEPWNYEYWLNKLDNCKNTIVTWSSKEKKKIICVVFAHEDIRKIAFMTSWCIVRGKDTFEQYRSKGYQCILYDFSKNADSSESVIGFTIRTNGYITDAYDKYDRSTYLPREFTPNNRSAVAKEFIKITPKQMYQKADKNIIKFVKSYIRTVLQSTVISRVIDFYDED
jgi:hypothetical protein